MKTMKIRLILATFFSLMIFLLTFPLKVNGAESEARKNKFYSTISDAIVYAKKSDIVTIHNSIYNRNLVADEALIIQSKNGPDSIVIKPKSNIQPVFDIFFNYVSIIGFTIREKSSSGIHIKAVKYCMGSNNTVCNNLHGITLENSNYKMFIQASNQSFLQKGNSCNSCKVRCFSISPSKKHLLINQFNNNNKAKEEG